MRNQPLFALLIIAVCVSSCTAYKASRQQKKDDKLQVAVFGNDRVFKKVIDYWNFAHPITQKEVYIKGKDSVIYSTDSIYIDRVKDSLIKIECPYLNLDSLRKANTKIIREYHTSIDTIIQIDSMAQHKLIVSNANVLYLQGKYDERSVDYFAGKKEITRLKAWRIGLIIFWLLTTAGLIYLIMKIKAKQAATKVQSGIKL